MCRVQNIVSLLQLINLFVLAVLECLYLFVKDFLQRYFRKIAIRVNQMCFY